MSLTTAACPLAAVETPTLTVRILPVFDLQLDNDSTYTASDDSSLGPVERLDWEAQRNSALP
jgi:hypothetical protein